MKTITNIEQIRLGTSNGYLVKGKNGYLLIDAGNKGQSRKFSKALKKFGINPREIKLIAVTHVHFDHVGSLYDIKTMCESKIAVHETEHGLLQKGDIVFPPGTNLFSRGISLIGRQIVQMAPKMPRVLPEIVVSDEISLGNIGIDGKIIHTPGHTKGSISVVLSTGEAFVGDLAINYLPFGLGPYFPPFAENVDCMLKSWKKLIDAKVKTIYPGHGSSFDIGELIKKYHSLVRKKH